MIKLISTQKEIEARRQELQEELEQLNTQETALKALTPAQQLAIELHGWLCRRNHPLIADGYGCSWYGEVDEDNLHNWEKNLHKQYLWKAQALLDAGFSHNDIMDMVQILYPQPKMPKKK